MKYKEDKNYMVEISLVDGTKDVFSLKGSAVMELREKIYQHGFTRDDKVNKGKICYWISPFVIDKVTITEQDQTLTEKQK